MRTKICSSCQKESISEFVHANKCYSCRHDLWRAGKWTHPMDHRKGNKQIFLYIERRATSLNKLRRIRESDIKSTKKKKITWGRKRKELERSKLIADQKGLCAICSCELASTQACLDHCHSTGTLRGVLCRSCNTALGLFKDSKERLEKAIHYIQRAR